MSRKIAFEMICIDEDWREYTNGIFSDEGDVYDKFDKDLPYITLEERENIGIIINGQELSGTTEEVITKLEYSFHEEYQRENETFIYVSSDIAFREDIFLNLYTFVSKK